jgi:hypothetical protein
MSVPESQDHSPAVTVSPPPLPHKALLLQIAWISGLVLGVAQLFFIILILLGSSFTPGPPVPLALFVATAVAAVQAFSAYRIRNGPVSARIIFALATALMMIFTLVVGTFLFAAVNAVPLVFLLLSQSTKPSRSTNTVTSSEATTPTITEAPRSRSEDLY